MTKGSWFQVPRAARGRAAGAAAQPVVVRLRRARSGRPTGSSPGRLRPSPDPGPATCQLSSSLPNPATTSRSAESWAVIESRRRVRRATSALSACSSRSESAWPLLRSASACFLAALTICSASRRERLTSCSASCVASSRCGGWPPRWPRGPAARRRWRAPRPPRRGAWSPRRRRRGSRRPRGSGAPSPRPARGGPPAPRARPRRGPARPRARRWCAGRWSPARRRAAAARPRASAAARWSSASAIERVRWASMSAIVRLRLSSSSRSWTTRMSSASRLGLGLHRGGVALCLLADLARRARWPPRSPRRPAPRPGAASRWPCRRARRRSGSRSRRSRCAATRPRPASALQPGLGLGQAGGEAGLLGGRAVRRCLSTAAVS